MRAVTVLTVVVCCLIGLGHARPMQQAPHTLRMIKPRTSSVVVDIPPEIYDPLPPAKTRPVKGYDWVLSNEHVLITTQIKRWGKDIMLGLHLRPLAPEAQKLALTYPTALLAGRELA
ncbi:uncharacterized protein PGTG_16108 [Puccinia graminis f. sp. tritici CRL 75-36-700-3]|uniref:Uncharacterized protein n=1 Tax=Puccinia graminis f. sp. tritici (strain CRL 75-36-700-3 / race SCCL) TaxID=418459 RepID=E3L1C3_PUCGT|nr:uncharacterized protein PGTG_16108 [Puccinia graminis f. sp. tritici CRL 75-36-700-3]EFP90348.1 hypothetical protein PGTG_16108 [Puccinia graminis f. sp. tritici CRL 75-36-700-3]